MKIRKVLDKKIGETSYFKYLVTLPKDVVENSGLLEKDLKVIRESNKIVIEKN